MTTQNFHERQTQDVLHCGQSPLPDAVMLWTGGKDSALALHLAQRRFNVVWLATFVPASAPTDFKAHPIPLIKAQSEALGIEHREVPIGPSYRSDYTAALSDIAAQGISTVITGDIAEVDGHPNWISECASGLVDVDLPLWHLDRHALLQTLLDKNFEIVISLAYRRYFDSDIVGRRLDESLRDELHAAQSRGVDPCGENGEYHSCVLDGPDFASRIVLQQPRAIETADYQHLGWSELCLESK